MMIDNNGYNIFKGTGYYSFQITLTASDGSQLIYWWGSSPATAPTQTGTVKVVNMGTIQGTFTVGQWVQFSRNLRADWTNAGLSSSASLTQPGYSGTGSGILTYTFSPALAVSSIPSNGNSLSMMIYNNGYNGPGLTGGTGYYSFQITLTASDGSQLIYWWGSSPATAPTQTGTIKVVNMGTIQNAATGSQQDNGYNSAETCALTGQTQVYQLPQQQH